MLRVDMAEWPQSQQQSLATACRDISLTDRWRSLCPGDRYAWQATLPVCFFLLVQDAGHPESAGVHWLLPLWHDAAHAAAPAVACDPSVVAN